MTKPVISVILPTFQPKDYILDCLTSLSKQTLSLDLFEVIIILNGEKDPYFKLINDNLGSLDKAIDAKLVYTEKKGVSNARNLGLKTAIGEYITFLDDDDFLSSNYLSDLYKTVLEQSDKLQKSTIACSNFKTFDGQNYGGDYLSSAFKKCSTGKYNLVKYRHFLSGISGKLLPKSMIGQTRFKNNLVIGEDSVFLFELSDKINKIVLSSEDVYYVRRLRKSSALRTNRSFKEKYSIFLKLISNYSRIYFGSPFKYNFLLYLSRILATFRVLF